MVYIAQDQLVLSDTSCPIQHILLVLLNQSSPVFLSKVVQINSDEAVVRGVLIGFENELGTLVGDVLEKEEWTGIN